MSSERQPKTVEARTSAPRLNLAGRAVRLGGDLLVYIYNDAGPHIGAVAAAEPRPSLADPARASATASVLAMAGHKEDLLARQAALELAAALGCRVVVTAGLHWDGLDRAGIEQAQANFAALVAELKRLLAAEGSEA